MTLPPKEIKKFQGTILRYYKKHRRNFPWRPPSLKLRKGREGYDAYAILVSEVMLQQTQAQRVVPFFVSWMKQFPTAKALAKAPVSKVLKAWQGLGYNRRALNLKRAGEMIVKEYGGNIPVDIQKIDALPGVGPYTAGAIGAFAFNLPSAFIETNIRTVYLHFFFKGRTKVSDEEILGVVKQTLPVSRQHSNILKNVGMSERRGLVREWYSALMDYGAMLKCTVGNPNIHGARYARQSAFNGSRRELRGKVLRLASRAGKVNLADFEDTTSPFNVPDVLLELVAEGFLKKVGKSYRLA